jgi:phage baseplate assembly protein gpV
MGSHGTGYTPGERILTGKLRVNTGDTTKIRDLGASWAAVEERREAGQIVQVVEGSLTVGTDRIGPESRYQINGTLTPYGQDLILAIQGSK